MNGEIKTLSDLKKLKDIAEFDIDNKSKNDIIILWKWQEDESIRNQVAIIETIFFLINYDKTNYEIYNPFNNI